MILALLAAVLPSAAPPAPEGATRSVTIAVVTKKGGPVEDLAAAEVLLTEDGRKRPVLGLERDQCPLEVALILDSSATMSAVW